MDTERYIEEIRPKAKELNGQERKELQSMLRSPVLKQALANVLVEAEGKERKVLTTNLTQENVIEINGERGEALGMTRAVAAIVEMVNG